MKPYIHNKFKNQKKITGYWKSWSLAFQYFLALLDNVSKADEIEIRPSSCRPSICGIVYLWSYCMDFFQILVVASTWPYAQTFFWKIFFFLISLWIFFVFVNMGPYGSKHFKTLLLQIAANGFPEFSSHWSSHNYVWDFLNFKNWNFKNFISFH